MEEALDLSFDRLLMMMMMMIKFGGNSCSAGIETWAASDMDIKRLGAWERKMLRMIHGPVIEQGIWRVRTDQN